MAEPVQTVDLDGRTFILPPGVEPVTRYRDENGNVHDTPEAAAQANARKRLEDIVYECASGYDFDIDFDRLLRRKSELIEALGMLP
jgi:hypothetical protein